MRFGTGHPETLDGSASPAYLMAELDFDSAEAMGEGMGSPAGRAAGADVADFASDGATMVHFDVQDAAVG